MRFLKVSDNDVLDIDLYNHIIKNNADLTIKFCPNDIYCGTSTTVDYPNEENLEKYFKHISTVLTNSQF